jgi:hypothetical protein
MKRRTYLCLALIILFLFAGISQTKNESKSDILQSFRPRSILIKDFLKTCEDNKINVLLLDDKMGNKSKMTRFTTYKASVIYVGAYGRKRITFLYNFKDDTLFTVKSY